MKTLIEEPKGLGGWLVLIAINLFIAAIEFAMSLVHDFLPIFQDGQWEALTTPGFEKYHHLWAPLLTFEMTGHAIFLIFTVVLIFLFFIKSYRFPALFITFLVLNLFFGVINFFLTDLIPAVATESHLEYIQELFTTFTWALFWIPYFLVSKRVKNTFIKPGITNSTSSH